MVRLLYGNQLLPHLGLQAHRMSRGGFFVFKRKGKGRVQDSTQTDCSVPSGRQQMGSSSLDCDKEQHLQVRGSGQHRAAASKGRSEDLPASRPAFCTGGVC